MPTLTRRTAAIAGVLVATLLGWTGTSALAQDVETAQLRILHGSPDAPPVDVHLDGAQILGDLAYGDISGYLEVAAGEHHVEVFPAGADAAAAPAIVDATLQLGGGTSTTLAATNTLAAIEAQLVTDAPEPTPDAVQVRAVHLSADTPPIDLAPDGGEAIVEDLAYATATEYVTLPAGSLDAEVRVSGAAEGEVAADLPSMALQAGTSDSLFLIGSLADGTFRVVTAVDALVPSAPSAWVRVLQGSPDAPALDVYVDGSKTAADLAFTGITDALELPAGEHQVQVVAAGMDPAAGTLIDATLTFAPGSASTIATTGPLAAITSQVILDDPAPAADVAQLRVVQLIPDAPAVQVIGDTAKKPLIKRLVHPRASRSLALKPGERDLRLKRADGTGPVLLDLDPVTLEAGTSTTLFLVGTLGSDTAQAVAVVDAPAG